MIVRNDPKPKPKEVPKDTPAPIYTSFEQEDFSKDQDELTYLEKLLKEKS